MYGVKEGFGSLGFKGVRILTGLGRSKGKEVARAVALEPRSLRGHGDVEWFRWAHVPAVQLPSFFKHLCMAYQTPLAEPVLLITCRYHDAAGFFS